MAWARLQPANPAAGLGVLGGVVAVVVLLAVVVSRGAGPESLSEVGSLRGTGRGAGS